MLSWAEHEKSFITSGLLGDQRIALLPLRQLELKQNTMTPFWKPYKIKIWIINIMLSWVEHEKAL